MRCSAPSALSLAMAAGALVAIGLPGSVFARVSPCRAGITEVAVDAGARAGEHRLHLCEAGTLLRSYPVDLGAGGLDKRREGDGKTPIGTYPLAHPRGSTSFGTFIHLGYPTEAQRRQGRTGSAIGIHGPSRVASGLGVNAIRVDWTAGCIALPTDREVKEVAAFVRRHRPIITIRDRGRMTLAEDQPGR